MEYLYYNIRHKIKEFTPEYFLLNQEIIIKKITTEINEVVLKMNEGSLVFISGLPFILANTTEFLDKSLKFNYWIACEFKPVFNGNDFPLTHFGLLFFQKINGKKPIPFNLNTKEYRVPHSICPSCDQLTKDWGGKKHTMNLNGTAFSDVWYIGDELTKENYSHNQNILKNITNLIGNDKKIELVNSGEIYDDTQVKELTDNKTELKINEFEYDNIVVNEDCIDFVEKINKTHPNGVFDIAFSDPPYNLNKNYSKYEDNLRDKEYIEWCEKWLYSKYKSLKPGGSLLVMNIPKWSLHHFNFLKKIMLFDKWIVWDALSTPAGKLMPAHYTILHFIKPYGDKKINNNIEMIPEKNYCLRNSCIKKRKNVVTINVTDIWRDCHRVKHNKNKNDHPCQLPIKLLNRIINKYSFEDDRIFDPFGGTGSAAVSSKINNRNFTITDIDEKYCDIANKNTQRVYENVFGVKEYVIESLPSKKKVKSNYNNKEVEERYMLICDKNKCILEIDQIKQIDMELHSLISSYPKSFKKLQSMTKRLKSL